MTATEALLRRRELDAAMVPLRERFELCANAFIAAAAKRLTLRWYKSASMRQKLEWRRNIRVAA